MFNLTVGNNKRSEKQKIRQFPLCQGTASSRNLEPATDANAGSGVKYMKFPAALFHRRVSLFLLIFLLQIRHFFFLTPFSATVTTKDDCLTQSIL